MATTTARVTPVVTKIIDGDGHLYERDEDIRPYLQGKYPEDTLRTYYLFPTLDGWRRGLPPRGHRYDAAGWAQFMDDTGIPWPGLRIRQGPRLGDRPRPGL